MIIILISNFNMNFEQLLQKINFFKKTENKFLIKYFLNWYFKYVNYLKYKDYRIKKLKLGALTFEINEISINGFVFYENISIKFTRQDNTKNDELKIENRLKNLAWKNDIYNILALTIVISVCFNFLYFQCFSWYSENLNTPLPELNGKNLNDFFYENLIFSSQPISFKNTNKILNDFLCELCDYFQIIA